MTATDKNNAGCHLMSSFAPALDHNCTLSPSADRAAANPAA